jgi:hypothetical protein
MIDESGAIKGDQRCASDWKEPQFATMRESGSTADWTGSDARRSMYLFYI